MRHTAVDLHAQLGDIGKLIGVVGRAVDGFAEVFAHFVLVNVKGSDKFNVANMIAAQVDVHQTGDEFIFVGIAVVVNPLHQR